MFHHLVRASLALAFLVLLLVPSTASAQPPPVIVDCGAMPTPTTQQFQDALNQNNRVELRGTCTFSQVFVFNDVRLTLAGASWTWDGTGGFAGFALINANPRVECPGQELINGTVYLLVGVALRIEGCTIDTAGFSGSAITVTDGSAVAVAGYDPDGASGPLAGC